MKGVALTKVKYTHGGILQETPLNIDLEINKETRDYKTGTLGGGDCRMGRVNKGD
jgi:hypothetical protein